MRYLITLLFNAVMLIHYSANSQSVQDTNIRISMISGHYSVHQPGGDLAQRFGISNSIGAEFTFKTASNWLLGADFSFIFGSDVKNSELYFAEIRNSKGYVLDGNGMFAEAFLYQRGFNISAMIGKQFDVLNFNSNSGPFIQLYAGYLQHYIRIENPLKTAPQITGDYAKLYDRLTTGFSTSQFVGYRFLSNRKLYNFYFGVELIQGFTQGRRSYNADDHSSINLPRIDLLTGFRVGWIVPLYGKSRQDFYYF